MCQSLEHRKESQTVTLQYIWEAEGKMAKQFGIQLVNPIFHIFHCTKQTVISRELCSSATFQMPLCWGGPGPELGSASLHCKMCWLLVPPGPKLLLDCKGFPAPGLFHGTGGNTHVGGCGHC